MSNFDEWFKVYRPSLDTSAIEAEFIFEAGQKSRQAEVEEKDKRIEELEQIINLHLDERFLDATWALRGEHE